MSIKGSVIELFKKVLWLSASVALVLMLGSASRKQRATQLVPKVKVSIDYKQGYFFIDEQDILNTIDDTAGDSINSQMVRSVPLSRIEEALLQNPFIRSADVYTDMQGTLVADIIQREPIIRVIHSAGVGYYLDERGDKMPHTGKFTARVPVATGFLTEQYVDFGHVETPVMKGLYQVALYISKDKFLQSLVDQVYVTEKGQYEIIPKIGNHTVILGTPDNLADKFNRLYIFYKEGLKNVGWSKYKSIDLRFSNQIVCKNRQSI